MPSLVKNSGVGGSTANVTGLNCTTALTIAMWCRCGQGSNPSTDVIRQASTANAARDGYRFGFAATAVRLDILSATGSNNHDAIQNSPHRDGRWHHYVVTYSDPNNEIFGYLDGKLIQRTATTQGISANASCTTTFNPNIIGNGNHFFYFDLQILPDVVVPQADIPVLMNPKYTYPGVKGRYFGLQFRTTAASANALRDESGNGNNLTISPSTIHQGEEPPYLPTIG